MWIIGWLVSNVLALAAAAWAFDGIRFDGTGQTLTAEAEDKALPLLLVALILGVVSAVVKPVLKVLSFPLILLTLGLFLLVINALMLLLTGWIAGQLDLGFTVDGFWPAVGGAVVITVVTWVVDRLIGAAD